MHQFFASQVNLSDWNCSAQAIASNARRDHFELGLHHICCHYRKSWRSSQLEISMSTCQDRGHFALISLCDVESTVFGLSVGKEEEEEVEAKEEKEKMKRMKRMKRERESNLNFSFFAASFLLLHVLPIAKSMSFRITRQAGMNGYISRWRVNILLSLWSSYRAQFAVVKPMTLFLE